MSAFDDLSGHLQDKLFGWLTEKHGGEYANPDVVVSECERIASNKGLLESALQDIASGVLRGGRK